MAAFKVTDSTTLSFDSGERLLFGGGEAPPQLAYRSGDDFLYRSGPTQFNLIDIDGGPFGAIAADGFFDLVLGFEINAGLGGLPVFSTGADVRVDATYAPIVFGDEDGSETQTFDFGNARVLTAESESQGLGAAVAFTDARGEERTVPVGLELNLVAGLEAGFRDIYTRAPFAFRGSNDEDGFNLINVEERPFTIFRLDATQAAKSIELGDFFTLDLRLPTGASTEGTSRGSTIFRQGLLAAGLRAAERRSGPDVDAGSAADPRRRVGHRQGAGEVRLPV